MAPILDRRRARARATTRSAPTPSCSPLPLSPEDQTVQSMADVSPTKWHRAHVTWFFETFVLADHEQGFAPFQDTYWFLFNSYYEAVGPRYVRGPAGRDQPPRRARRRRLPRQRRRPDARPASPPSTRARSASWPPRSTSGSTTSSSTRSCCSWTSSTCSRSTRSGRPTPASPSAVGDPDPLGWVDVEGGLVEIGHRGDGFSFDNELPLHQVHLEPFRLADRLVTNGEWLAFMADGGYHRPELWLSDGWARVSAEGWEAPFYWTEQSTGSGSSTRSTAPGRSTRRCRSPTSATTRPTPMPRGPASGCRPRPSGSTASARRVAHVAGNLADSETFHPRAAGPATGAPPPGLRRLLGVDLVGLPALPGLPPGAPVPSASTTASSCPTRWSCAVAVRSPPPGHARASYRNFFPPGCPVGALRGYGWPTAGPAVPGALHEHRARAGRLGAARPGLGQRQPGRRRTPRADPAPADAAPEVALRRRSAPSCSTRSPGCRTTTRSRRSGRSWWRMRPTSRRRAGRPAWSSSAAGPARRPDCSSTPSPPRVS